MGPSTHHEDKGPQALSQCLAKQPVADMEHLPAAGHQLLLSTHGRGRRRRCQKAGGVRRGSSGGQHRVAPFIAALRLAPRPQPRPPSRAPAAGVGGPPPRLA